MNCPICGETLYCRKEHQAWHENAELAADRKAPLPNASDPHDITKMADWTGDKSPLRTPRAVSDAEWAVVGAMHAATRSSRAVPAGYDPRPWTPEKLDVYKFGYRQGHHEASEEATEGREAELRDAFLDGYIAGRDRPSGGSSYEAIASWCAVRAARKGGSARE